MKIAWLLAALLFGAAIEPLRANLTFADQVRVLDGDTVGVFNQKPGVRLVGLNAPETRRAQRAAERELGGKAREGAAM